MTDANLWALYQRAEGRPLIKDAMHKTVPFVLCSYYNGPVIFREGDHREDAPPQPVMESVITFFGPTLGKLGIVISSSLARRVAQGFLEDGVDDPSMIRSAVMELSNQTLALMLEGLNLPEAGIGLPEALENSEDFRSHFEGAPVVVGNFKTGEGGLTVYFQIDTEATA